MSIDNKQKNEENKVRVTFRCKPRKWIGGLHGCGRRFFQRSAPTVIPCFISPFFHPACSSVHTVFLLCSAELSFSPLISCCPESERHRRGWWFCMGNGSKKGKTCVSPPDVTLGPVPEWYLFLSNYLVREPCFNPMISPSRSDTVSMTLSSTAIRVTTCLKKPPLPALFAFRLVQPVLVEVFFQWRKQAVKVRTL